MMFYITKQSGSNTVQIAEQVKEELEKIQPTLPKDISFNLVLIRRNLLECYFRFI
jgi:multidrug efflux pump subunit AcrB